MSYFDPTGFPGMFDYLVLNAFGNGPLTRAEFRVRLRTASVYLDLLAARTGIPNSPDSLFGKLDQFQRDGLLEAQTRGTDNFDFQITYSLTRTGEAHLQGERERREMIVSRFLDEANLDESFRRFLDKSAFDQG